MKKTLIILTLLGIVGCMEREKNVPSVTLGNWLSSGYDTIQKTSSYSGGHRIIIYGDKMRCAADCPHPIHSKQ